MRTGLASVFNVQKPTVRVKNVSNDSKMDLNFNNKMLLPENFKEKVKQNRLLSSTDQDSKPLIEIQSIAGEGSDSDLIGLDWTLSEAGEEALSFKLIYTDPLEVSQNETPDKVKVLLNLSEFTDEYGQTLGNDTILIVDAPRQIPSEEEAQAIEKGGESSEAASSSVMGGNLILNIILAASLNQLWTMLNGLQLSTHMQLFNLKFPANASFLLNFLVTVATFDVMPIETIWFFFDFPE